MSVKQSSSSRNFIQVSTQFKTEALKAVAAIVGFIVVYFALIALSLGLIVLCFYGGASVIMIRPSVLTFIIGLGMIGGGILVFVFLVKFMFSSNKTDNSDSVQIMEEDHPALFQSIRRLAKDAGTPMPRKVFLSSDVNACVFYNSSFWSMFLPVRKNLKIGLGLVNAVNVSELEAVIAHEFGHFSQRSMKVGSWVYQVNRIIYDMLYNNQGFSAGIGSLASGHAIFQLFASLAVRLIQGIQWVLGQMYRVVNKAYLGLSRQMEFHADHVAASICGSNNIIHSLRRIEFAGACFEKTIDVCNKAWQEKKVANEVYSTHRLIYQQEAKNQQFAFVEGLPLINEQEEGITTRVVFKNQWSSHPTLQERKEYLDQFDLVGEVNEQSAWVLFKDAEALKSELTKVLYRNIPQGEVKEELDGASLAALAEKDLENVSLPPVYREYYDLRQIQVFDVEAAVAEPFKVQRFDEVLDGETISIPKRMRSIQADLGVLTAIKEKGIDTRSFDFDGHKYKREEAQMVSEQLLAEFKELEEKLKLADRRLFCFFYSQLPLAQAEALKKEYLDYFKLCDDKDAFFNCVTAMMDPLLPIYKGETLQFEQINELIKTLKKEHEPAFKTALGAWAEYFVTNPKLKERAEQFIASDYKYFTQPNFNDAELNGLNLLVQDSWTAVSACVFEKFRGIAVQQASVVEAGGVLA